MATGAGGRSGARLLRRLVSSSYSYVLMGVGDIGSARPPAAFPMISRASGTVSFLGPPARPPRLPLRGVTGPVVSVPARPSTANPVRRARYVRPPLRASPVRGTRQARRDRSPLRAGIGRGRFVRLQRPPLLRGTVVTVYDADPRDLPAGAGCQGQAGVAAEQDLAVERDVVGDLPGR
ncbi:hypothetical protein [Streptomyces eurythermus]|uniref:hypothetical protein n=1 Tax=Streptomyces eurythermus TaxID=42237 RepID=UPI0036F6B56B